jgi:hypothetical protein
LELAIEAVGECLTQTDTRCADKQPSSRNSQKENSAFSSLSPESVYKQHFHIALRVHAPVSVLVLLFDFVLVPLRDTKPKHLQ